LLELMLTLAVIVAISSVAIPNLFVILADRQLVRSGDGVRIAMVEARLEAMRTGRTHVMKFQIGGPQFKVEPFRTADDVTEAADMLGQGTSAMMGGAAVIPMADPNPNANANGTSIGLPLEDRDVMDARMDQEMLVGSAVFGQPQIQATARSATMQQPGMMGGAMNPADASTATGGDGWSQPLMFYADGTTSNAVIVVQAEGIGKVLVKIRGLTGETDVTEVRQ
jgi:hypothetical protein